MMANGGCTNTSTNTGTRVSGKHVAHGETGHHPTPQEKQFHQSEERDRDDDDDDDVS